MSEPRIDLHLHTTASDGSLTPAELAAAVRRAGVSWWAIADHDTCEGWRAVAGEPGLIPAAEITAGQDGREVHVVGLGIEPGHPGLASLLAAIRDLRRERIGLLIRRLPTRMRAGLDVDTVAKLGAPQPPATLTRLHLARALVARGCACSTTAAFAEWLGDEHAADADLPAFPAIAEVAQAIRAAGGLAILAHPGQHRTRDAVAACMAAGLDGLETAHPGLDSGLGATLAADADAAGWWRSAGSDLHWLGARRPGMCRLPAEARERLVRRLCDAIPSPMASPAESA